MFHSCTWQRRSTAWLGEFEGVEAYLQLPARLAAAICFLFRSARRGLGMKRKEGTVKLDD